MLHMKALEKQKHQKLRVAGKRELIVKTKIRKQKWKKKPTKTEWRVDSLKILTFGQINSSPKEDIN